MARVCFFISVILLAGCATYPATYNPADLPSEELATVTFEKTGFMDSRFWGSVVSVYDENSTQVIESDAGFGFGTKDHKEVFLPEGRYLIVAYCTNGSVYSHPRIPLEVKGGKTYTLACKNHTEKGFLGISMNRSVSLELLSKDRK